jgi:hypothetical protein
LKTACFHTAGMHPSAIAVCRYMPRWMRFSGRKYSALAPTSAMLKMDSDTFDAAYYAQLAALNPRQVFADLVALAGVEALLLCHEKPGAPCHRLTVARWLETALGIDVPELDAPIVGLRTVISGKDTRPSLTDPDSVELYLRRQLKLDL